MTKAKAPEPWQPVAYDEQTAHAVKALANGTASEGQQKTALNWIVHEVCATYDMPFQPGGPDGDRATCFAAGRMFAGKQIVKLINLDMRVFVKPTAPSRKRQHDRA